MNMWYQPRHYYGYWEYTIEFCKKIFLRTRLYVQAVLHMLLHTQSPAVFIRHNYISTDLLNLIEVNEFVQVWLREESENWAS